uniref:Bm7818 n=1 Tax=Brugia malayi TaxID=6279 RepID=A0A1I9GCA2_BRUMA|nr:Bm7818 [Brugia malayi]
MNCPQLRDKELASQAGLTPFGGIREHVIKVQDKEGEKKKDINKIVCDQTSESILKIWSQANPDAKNGQLFGKHRDAVMEVKGGREFNQKELNASRAAIPKFQDPRETLAAKAKKANNTRFNGLINNRQEEIVKQIKNEKKIDDNIMDSHYMACIGGQITLQSQPYQDDIQMSHNIITKSKPYFDRVMSERKYGIEKIMEAKVQCHQKRKGNGMMGKKFKLGERERRLNEVQMEDEK